MTEYSDIVKKCIQPATESVKPSKTENEPQEKCLQPNPIPEIAKDAGNELVQKRVDAEEKRRLKIKRYTWILTSKLALGRETSEDQDETDNDAETLSTVPSSPPQAQSPGSEPTLDYQYTWLGRLGSSWTQNKDWECRPQHIQPQQQLEQTAYWVNNDGAAGYNQDLPFSSDQTKTKEDFPVAQSICAGSPTGNAYRVPADGGSLQTGQNPICGTQYVTTGSPEWEPMAPDSTTDVTYAQNYGNGISYGAPRYPFPTGYYPTSPTFWNPPVVTNASGLYGQWSPGTERYMNEQAPEYMGAAYAAATTTTTTSTAILHGVQQEMNDPNLMCEPMADTFDEYLSLCERFNTTQMATVAQGSEQNPMAGQMPGKSNAVDEAQIVTAIGTPEYFVPEADHEEIVAFDDQTVAADQRKVAPIRLKCRTVKGHGSAAHNMTEYYIDHGYPRLAIVQKASTDYYYYY